MTEFPLTHTHNRRNCPYWTLLSKITHALVRKRAPRENPGKSRQTLGPSDNIIRIERGIVPRFRVGLVSGKQQQRLYRARKYFSNIPAVSGHRCVFGTHLVCCQNGRMCSGTVLFRHLKFCVCDRFVFWDMCENVMEIRIKKMYGIFWVRERE